MTHVIKEPDFYLFSDILRKISQKFYFRRIILWDWFTVIDFVKMWYVTTRGSRNKDSCRPMFYPFVLLDSCMHHLAPFLADPHWPYSWASHSWMMNPFLCEPLALFLYEPFVVFNGYKEPLLNWWNFDTCIGCDATAAWQAPPILAPPVL